MSEQNDKLVNVKFRPEIGEKLDVVAKTRSMKEGRNVTVTEVVRTAAEQEVEREFRDAEFLASARETLKKQEALLGL
jgi:hypothetical protein